jgi:hypothetical protein
MRKTTVGFCLLALAGIAHSQEPDAGEVVPLDPAAEARQYAVELIIFAYNEDVSVGTELFVPELIENDDGVPVFSDMPHAPAVPAEISEVPEMELLPAGQYSLRDSYGRLSRLRAYEPLMHFGWIQAAMPDAEPVLLDLDRFGSPPQGLEGTVSLTLSRYLHLALDLKLAAPVGSVADMGDRSAGIADNPGLRYAPLRYELAEDRIMKPGETRYFDHPKFGVIAKVSRYGNDEN